MGFFDFLDGEKGHGAKGAHKSVTIATNNFQKALQAAASKLNLTYDDIDFKLNKVETFIKPAGLDAFEPISNQHADTLRSKEALLSPELLFKQTYNLTFEKKLPHKYHLNALLESNSSHSMAKAKILKSSVFPIGPDLKKWLVYELNRFKLRNNIMLSIFEWNMKKETETLASRLMKEGELNEDVEISLSYWPVPAKVTVDDNLIYHYEKGHGDSDSVARVDHADRNYANFITHGTLLIEYIKPAPGITGREYSGKLIEAHEPVVKHEIMFNADGTTIETQENDRNIKFFAKKDGYVMMEGGLLKIADELQVNSIDLKSTGNIKSNMDKDISISIKGDASEDKIGPNMEVEVANLNIGGSVAEGAQIRSKNLVIGGQTHLTSKIYTQKAQIKVHKGYLEAAEAVITTIENGRVLAGSVVADAAIGAEIHAKTVHIKEIKSHCAIEFSESLVIDKIGGNENKFILTPFAQKEEGEAIEKAIAALSEKKLELMKIDKKHEQLTVSVRKNQPVYEEVTEALREIKNKNQEPNPALLKRFNDLVTEIKIFEKLEEKSKKLQEEIAVLETEVQACQQKLFHAIITIKSEWHGFNEVYFQMIAPKKMLKYQPREHSGPEEIAVVLNEEGDYEVKRRVYKDGMAATGNTHHKNHVKPSASAKSEAVQKKAPAQTPDPGVQNGAKPAAPESGEAGLDTSSEAKPENKDAASDAPSPIRETTPGDNP